MSSATPIIDKGLFSTFLAVHHPLSENDVEEKPAEQPVEKPAEKTQTAWKPGGYTPKRANWNTVSGKIKRYLS